MKFVVPEVVASHFHLHEGDKVADFGAGSGFFLKTLSAAVGDQGRVYACEIQKKLVEKVGSLVQSQGLQNVDTLWCDLETVNGNKLPDDELDAGILVNTLFQIEDRSAAAIEMARVLRTGGKLLVIDWTETVIGLGPVPDKLITAADCMALFESHGFIFERDFPAGEHHYGLAFRKI
jgi:ubiquinone/menaquinone biosynthesis C-methylase UbiE